MSLPASAIAATGKEAGECIFLIRIGSSPVRRYTSHLLGWKLPSNDDVDPNGEYIGRGVLVDIPEIPSITGTEAVREEFTFSAVDDTLDWVFGGNRITASNQAEIDFAFLYLNPETGLATGKPLWISSLSADVATQRLTQDGVMTVSLSCHSGDVKRVDSQPLFWTDASQQSKYAGDLFFNNTNWMNAQSSIKWPE